LLVVGCWLLVVGCWLLVVGCWLLVVGCWLLVVGCWLLVVGLVMIGFDVEKDTSSHHLALSVCEENSKPYSGLRRSIPPNFG
jgi:uncharacterized membrane protein